MLAVGAEIGQDVGQEEDGEKPLNSPEDGFDDSGRRDAEEAGEIGRHIEEGAGAGIEVRTLRNDGGDFGEVDAVEGGSGEIQGGFDF